MKQFIKGDIIVGAKAADKYNITRAGVKLKVVRSLYDGTLNKGDILVDPCSDLDIAVKLLDGTDVCEYFVNSKYFRLLTQPEVVKLIKVQNKTIVILPNGKKGIATKHPDDQYDEKIGAIMAFARAYGVELPEEVFIAPKPNIKSGDIVELKHGLMVGKKYGHLTFLGGGMKFCGLRRVVDILGRGSVRLDSEPYYYSTEMLNVIKEGKHE